ncbi:ArsR/SmtB family transcription factor [Candidatus Solirubrobacter pratensis]|uniref:ArsR/SmtB family transcription factor n=1 Tax=Candidatus Solirubrobacter pratensis TaxID=1298857 RepID=UPI0003F75E74|nr:helix-turn-helix transcriptional regulator [Candidatus Solirubrobacter pratensis]
MLGDTDLASVGALIGEPARARVLMALADGRELPASVLASEAGVAASTASAHLARLVEGGLVAVESRGRHRYFRVSGPAVGRAIEALAAIAPPAPVRSLKDGTRAQALRAARTCYDHLAGRLGVDLMAALVRDGILQGGDGRHHRERAHADRPSAYGRDVDYRLSDRGAGALDRLGVDLDAALAGRRPPIRYCVDWSEQDHHLSGALGAALAHRLKELDWIRPLPGSRAVKVTPEGRRGLEAHFGLRAATGGG